jgi:hypothetical protein
MAGTASLVPLRPTTISLRAAHLGFAAMSHADMAETASLVPLCPTTISLRVMRFAAVLRTFAHLAPALLRAAHLGFAAMSHADMAGTASLVPLRPTTISLRAMRCAAAHLRSSRARFATSSAPRLRCNEPCRHGRNRFACPIASHYYIPTSDALRCCAPSLISRCRARFATSSAPRLRCNEPCRHGRNRFACPGHVAAFAVCSQKKTSRNGCKHPSGMSFL